MGFTIYPWDLRSWRRAFRVAGIPGIALFFLLMGSMLQIADITGGGAGHASAKLILLIRTPSAVLAFLLLLYRPRIATTRLTDVRVGYSAFALLYFASTLWSKWPIQTVGKSAELLLAGLVFLEATRGENALRRVEALRQIILLTISTLGFITVVGYLMHLSAFIQQRPGLLTKTTAQAPFLSGNGLGYVASALFLVVFAEWMAHRLTLGNALRQMIFALALFSLSASRTSFGILLLSVIVVVAKRSKLLAAMLVGGLAMLGFTLWTVIVSKLKGHQTASSFSTLSGRTVVWAAALHLFEKHPFIGVGGGIGGKVVISNIGDMYLEQMSSLHNGFLEVLTGLGLIGFVLGAAMLVLATWRAWKAWNTNPEYAGTYVLIVHVWLTTIMSTGILGWMGFEVALFLCIISNLDLIRRRAYLLQSRTAWAPQWSPPILEREQPAV